MNRRRFLALAGGAALLAACGNGTKTADPPPSPATTKPGPGAGNPDDVLLRTAAALSLAAAAVHDRAGGEVGAIAAANHRAHAQALDPTVTEPHQQASTAWATPFDAELAIAATCQAWAAVLTTPELRQKVMTVGGSAARLSTAVQASSAGVPSLPEAFQLVDPAISDDWLLS